MNIESKIADISSNHYEPLLNLPNVNGVGLGYKYINGVKTDKLCLHVTVEKKLSKDDLCQNILIPKSHLGIETDVMEIGVIEPRSLKGRIRPLQGGYSVGIAQQSSYGTIGCIVTKKVKGEKLYFALSNNHVLADLNKFSVGTNIIQPSKPDGGKLANDKIGELYQYVPIKFTGLVSKPTNYVDAAIVKLTNSSLATDVIARIGKVKSINTAKIDMVVLKAGRTTELTSGAVRTLNFTTTITFARNKKAIFKNQIVSSNYNESGDSGALVVDEKDRAVGLLFSGTEHVCIFNDIHTVLKALDVELFVR